MNEYNRIGNTYYKAIPTGRYYDNKITEWVEKAYLAPVQVIEKRPSQHEILERNKEIFDRFIRRDIMDNTWRDQPRPYKEFAPEVTQENTPAPAAETAAPAEIITPAENPANTVENQASTPDAAVQPPPQTQGNGQSTAPAPAVETAAPAETVAPAENPANTVENQESKPDAAVQNPQQPPPQTAETAPAEPHPESQALGALSDAVT